MVSLMFNCYPGQARGSISTQLLATVLERPGWADVRME